MPDYKKMTLERLRELARKALGPGHARKSKAELVSALEAGGKAAPAAPRGAKAAAGKAPRKAAGKARSGASAGGKAEEGMVVSMRQS